MNLRLTKLRDLAGNVHYVRNGEITVVTNMTKDYSRYVFDVGIAYRENVDEVIAVLKQIDEEMRQDAVYGADILEPLVVLGLDRFDDSAVVVRVRTKTKPIRQWAVGREFNRRMKERFDELGIEIPFPHVTLYMGQGKDGSAPPCISGRQAPLRMPSLLTHNGKYQRRTPDLRRPTPCRAPCPPASGVRRPRALGGRRKQA